MFGCICNFVVTRHAPFTYRSDYFDFWRKGVNCNIEAHLVIAFASTTMCHSNCTLCMCNVYQEPRYQRTCKSSCQRILSLIDSSSLKRRRSEERRVGKERRSRWG